MLNCARGLDFAYVRCIVQKGSRLTRRKSNLMSCGRIIVLSLITWHTWTHPGERMP